MEQKTGYPHPPPDQVFIQQPGFVNPNQPGHPPQGYTTTTTAMVMQQPNIQVGPDPMRLSCPSCGAAVLTKMRYEPTTKTHMMALLLFCCICWPCVCVPYCMDSCQNANHYCPNCDAFIGTYAS